MPSLPQRLKPVRSPGQQIAKKPAKRYSVIRARDPVSRSPRPWIAKSRDHQRSSKRGATRPAPEEDREHHDEDTRAHAGDTITAEFVGGDGGDEGFDDSDDNDNDDNDNDSAGKSKRVFGGASRTKIVAYSLLALCSAVAILIKYPMASVVPIALLPLFIRPRWVAVLAPVVVVACCFADSAFMWGMSGIWLAYIVCLLERPGAKCQTG